MDLRRLAALAAVLACLSATATLLYWRSVRDEAKTPLEGVKPGAVSKLVIDRAGASLVLERDGDAWGLTSPIKDRGDANAVNDVLNAVLQLRLGAEAAGDPASYRDYEVDEGSATRLRLYASDQAAAVFDAYLGKAALGGDSLYLRLSREKPVYVASGLAPYQLDRKPSDFRDHGITRIDRTALASIGFQTDRRSIELSKSSSGWSAAGAEISPDKVELAVDRILALRVGDFIDDEVKAARTGLDKPSATVVIRDAVRTQTLRIGKPQELKGGQPVYRYAQASGRTPVLLLSFTDVEAIVDLLGAGAPRAADALPKGAPGARPPASTAPRQGRPAAGAKK
ncbi:MAG: DUF4340 domain-containing protein [Elusimicrobia bacterium]|nr:DUF4340 domain-containing protein [Elusimicrobiota bacterium]